MEERQSRRGRGWGGGGGVRKEEMRGMDRSDGDRICVRHFSFKFSSWRERIGRRGEGGEKGKREPEKENERDEKGMKRNNQNLEYK